MYRNSSRFNIALILGALVLTMVLLGGCVTTPEIVVSTTAKQIDPSAVVALTASPLFDIPENKCLLVGTIETEKTCMNNCKCPGPRTKWGDLGVSERLQIMLDLIQAGAKGFVHVVRDKDIARCACHIVEERREPIRQLPFTLGDVTLYRVERDGTVIAKAGDVTYSFRPSDTWSYTRVWVTGSRGSDNVMCESFTHITKSSFQNDGLFDKSQLLGD